MATPKSPCITLSVFQRTVLSKITRQTTASIREVNRAQLILAIAEGSPNSLIAQRLNCSIPKVRAWRRKWLESQSHFQQIESDPEKQSQLEAILREFLQDRPRPGTPATYTSEEYCQILALALAPPEESGRPITEWTSGELADECKKRGITSGISERQIGRFLKRIRCQTPSKSLLAPSES